MDDRDYEAMNKRANFDWDKFAIALRDKFGKSLISESLINEDGDEDNPYNWWLEDVKVSDIVDFVMNHRQDGN
jgi:hypothetical protein